MAPNNNNAYLSESGITELDELMNASKSAMFESLSSIMGFHSDQHMDESPCTK